MKKTVAMKVLAVLTLIKTNLDTYIPVQVVRDENQDFVFIVNTVAPLGQDQMNEFEAVRDEYELDMQVHGTYVMFK